MRSFRFFVTAFSAIALVALLAGCGKSTSPTAVTPDSTAPSAPTNLSYSVASGSGVLTWSPDPSGSASSYVVFVYDPDPSRESAYTGVGTTTTTSFEIPGAYQIGVHYYRVQSVNNGGNHSASSAAVIVPSLDRSGGGNPGGSGEGHPRTD